MEAKAVIQRFLILGAARTGSNLLLSLLSDHPNIKTYGELFNLDTLPKENLTEALEDPIAFLQRRVYKTQGAEIGAVGFKIFYDHLTPAYFQKPIDVSAAAPRFLEKLARFSNFIEAYDRDLLYGRFRTTWEFLYADRSLAVIHLKRKNMLHTLISLKRAFMTKQWWNLKGNPLATPTVYLDPEECSGYFKLLESSAAEGDIAFSSHPKIDVIYEDLVENQEDTLQRVFTLLNVPDRPVTTRMRKQNLAPSSDVVDNYDQLKEFFQPTKWGAFFE